MQNATATPLPVYSVTKPVDLGFIPKSSYLMVALCGPFGALLWAMKHGIKEANEAAHAPATAMQAPTRAQQVDDDETGTLVPDEVMPANFPAATRPAMEAALAA